MTNKALPSDYFVTEPMTSPGVDTSDGPNLTIGVLLGVMILLIALGNTLVVLAVFLERRLRTFENFFFASLAVADLSIAVFVLPFCLTVELSGHWKYSYTACDMFIFTDVACCTASILHLCVIGLNRCWSIMYPLKYATRQTCRFACKIISGVWLMSFIIACPPLFGWPKRRRELEDQCDYDVDKVYVIYSSCGSFYIPLLVMTVVYVQIFRLSKKGAQFRRLSSYQSNGKQPGSAPASPKENKEERSFQRQNSHPSKDSAQRKESYCHEDSQERKRAKIVALICPIVVRKEPKQKPKRCQAEIKTAKTLGIIMGAFVVCWLPFFLLYVIKPLCGDACYVPIWVDRFALWLGYFNSLLNPLIYICCKPLFRITFKRILTLYYCRKSFESKHRRHEMHYYRGRYKQAVNSWDCPVAVDNSLMRGHEQRPEGFGEAFSEGYREKGQGGLRQMPLKEYAKEFHHVDKCSLCSHDVDPLDVSGANQDIEDYLNYVIANGYLRQDMCKDIGINDLFSPHKCKTGKPRYHCGHCCKANTPEPSSSSAAGEEVQTLSKQTCNDRLHTSGDAVGSTMSSNQDCKTDAAVSKTISQSELCLQEAKVETNREEHFSPSTENTWHTTCASPTDDIRKSVTFKDKDINCVMTTSPYSIGLTRDLCLCSIANLQGHDIARVASTEIYKETGL